MALFTEVLSANNQSSYVCDVDRRRAASYYLATILVYGTFSSGTVELYISPDKGTTKIPITASPGGPPVTFTANGMVLVNFGNITTSGPALQIFAGITGAGTPSVTVAVYDNR